MKARPFLAPILSIALCPLLARALDPAFDQGLHLIEEGRTTLEEAPLNTAKNIFTKLTQADANNAAAWYQLARTNRYLVETYTNRNDKKNAERAIEEAIIAVQRSISINDNSSDSHSLLADLYGRKIGMGVFLGGPRFGPKVSAENKRALALDAANPRVHASLGRQYLMSPSMFGGDVDKAIEEFRKATELDTTFDEAYVWLAIACTKKNDKACADKARQDALRLNPRSTFARNLTPKK